MALDRAAILLDNLRESLNFYQRALVWAMTAAAAHFLLTLRLREPANSFVSVVYGQLSAPAAWAVAFALFDMVRPPSVQ